MKLYPFFLLSILCSGLIANHPLLQKPNPITQEAVEKQAAEWQTCFTWCSTWRNHQVAACSFAYDKGKAGFALKVLSIPFYWKQYRLLPTLEELKFVINEVVTNYDKPLFFENQKPTQINKDELMKFIESKKCIFYTGAGISMHGNVPGMTELMKNLKMEHGTKEFLKATWQQPEELCFAFQKFCESAINAAPSPAHFALKTLAENKSAAILTENVDLLHQRTGIEPIHTYSKKLAELTPEQWQQIEAIICVGLRYDDKGLLAHYKKHNPHGIFIAIDLATPTYVSSNDYVCLGDLQEILCINPQSTNC